MEEQTKTLQEVESDVVDEFSMFDEWLDKYEYLIELGKSLKSYPETDKTDDRLIKGCQSRVWLDYKIEDIEKVNDHLYAITVQTKTNTSVLHHGDEFEIVYNFVGNIDGKWYFMNGISHIPASIRDNLDPNKYTYDDDRIVNKEDVIMP